MMILIPDLNEMNFNFYYAYIMAQFYLYIALSFIALIFIFLWLMCLFYLCRIYLFIIDTNVRGLQYLFLIIHINLL